MGRELPLKFQLDKQVKVVVCWRPRIITFETFFESFSQLVEMSRSCMPQVQSCCSEQYGRGKKTAQYHAALLPLSQGIGRLWACAAFEDFTTQKSSKIVWLKAVWLWEAHRGPEHVATLGKNCGQYLCNLILVSCKKKRQTVCSSKTNIKRSRLKLSSLLICKEPAPASC